MRDPKKVKLVAFVRVKVVIPLTVPLAENAPAVPAFRLRAFDPPPIDARLILAPVVPDVMDLMTVVPVNVRAGRMMGESFVWIVPAADTEGKVLPFSPLVNSKVLEAPPRIKLPVFEKVDVAMVHPPFIVME